MQQALLKGRSKHPIAPAVPARFRASVPIIPTHVLDRSLHDANQITHLVICRKVVFCAAQIFVAARCLVFVRHKRHDTGPHLFAPHKKAQTIAGPGHELDVRGRNIGRRRGVSGEERTPRRQALKLFTSVVQVT